MNAFFRSITAVTLAASVAVAAQAQPSVRVNISDLNLASAQDQKVLELRIARAARAVCASEAVSQLPANMRAENECRETTKAALALQIAARVGVATASR